ncbi:MAG: hypothetical protein A2X28_03440 [Elusimicrobia bacterium GWA2_56_46]|nr:MAG: hypothetical protein A2X28_03440 [Elusimicrobia bacterium GWA2_56_46]OGR54224.1 MAG: hypothetical protein A2X39_09085 [Elusimicrobia bacterium GWC2_56_31]HBB67735.1 hypothetical protein [Elusimicrobiota bacterium]HBW21802.1 hypothetical protein [Elusimicrobiota bacterium]
MNRTSMEEKAVSEDASVAGALIMEHKLIERMIRVLSRETAAGQNGETIAVGLLAAGVDFFNVYADRCHHAKEDNILFRELGRKPLSPEHKKVLDELTGERHERRILLDALLAADERRKAHGPRENAPVVDALKAMCKFYRAHIEKADNHFLPSAMSYLSREEEALILDKFRRLDSILLKENCSRQVEYFE